MQRYVGSWTFLMASSSKSKYMSRFSIRERVEHGLEEVALVSSATTFLLRCTPRGSKIRCKGHDGGRGKGSKQWNLFNNIGKGSKGLGGRLEGRASSYLSLRSFTCSSLSLPLAGLSLASFSLPAFSLAGLDLG